MCIKWIIQTGFILKFGRLHKREREEKASEEREMRFNSKIGNAWVFNLIIFFVELNKYQHFSNKLFIL
jgi:hypothetical protein